MKPEQANALRVALDRLKEWEVSPDDVVRAMYDEKTAARMLEAVKPVDMNALGDLAEAGFIAWRNGERNNEPTWAQVAAAIIYAQFGPEALDSEVRARFTRLLGPFSPRGPRISPPVKPTGAHAPQPQTPPTETPSVTDPSFGCSICGRTFCDCETSIDLDGRFPGAGAG